MQTFSFSKPKGIRPGDEDTRYRITVMLVATKRPRYWTFYCNHCGNKVTEVSGEQVLVSDVSDVNAIPDWQPAPVKVYCSGHVPGSSRSRCGFWYEFATLSKNLV